MTRGEVRWYRFYAPDKQRPVGCATNLWVAGIPDEEADGGSTMKNMKGMKREFGELFNRVIGCAIEVHRVLGPGLLES